MSTTLKPEAVTDPATCSKRVLDPMQNFVPVCCLRTVVWLVRNVEWVWLVAVRRLHDGWSLSFLESGSGQEGWSGQETTFSLTSEIRVFTGLFSPGFVARIQVVLLGSRFCCQNPGFAARIPLAWVELVADHWPATGSLVDLWDVFLSCLSSELIKILLIFLLAVVDGFRSVGMIKASVVFWVQPSLNIQNFCRLTFSLEKVIKLCVYVLKIISSYWEYWWTWTNRRAF